MIVILCGKSCVGKDSIIKKLTGYNRLISYTSRPMRNNEVNGVDYWFISKEEIERLRDDNKILDYREYKVSNGEIWGYGHCIREYDEEEVYVGVGDLEGCKRFKEVYKDNVYIIYIDCDKESRLERAKLRGDDLKEVERRFFQDDIDFDNKKLYNIVDYSVENTKDLDTVVNEIVKYIEDNK